MQEKKVAIRDLQLTGAGGPGSRSVVAVAALLSIFGTIAVAQTGGISVEKQWIRFIIRTRPAAGFFTIKNDTAQAVELTGASSPGCGSMTLHRSKEENGVEKMLPVENVTVPAHGTFDFQQGGYHIMCMKPQASMKVGTNVPVTLKFMNGQTVTAQFKVTGPAGK